MRLFFTASEQLKRVVVFYIRQKIWSPTSDIAIAVILAGTAHWWLFTFWAAQGMFSAATEQFAERESRDEKGQESD